MELDSVASEVRRDLIRAGVSSEEAERFSTPLARYALLVAEWAPRMNLTAARVPRAIAQRFLIPPFVWSELLPSAPETIVDIGSGAGFPGIALAVRFPDASVWMVEARAKRHFFQRHVIRTVGLANATALLGREETLDRIECDLAVAQALAPLSEAAFHVKPWTSIGGLLAIPQSTHQPAIADPDLNWVGCPRYADPFSPRPAFLWMSRRKS